MSDIKQNSRWPVVLAALFIVAVLFSQGSLGGSFGTIGPDSDDMMRLLQVRDFFQGQSWFDVNQYRLGLEGGTAMHWSRLPDIPLILLIGFFDLFLPYAVAESVAITFWPPLCFLIVFIGVVKASKFTGGQYTLIFSLILMVFLFTRSHRFYSGAIDHHNIQMGLLAIAIGFAADPKGRARSYAISGMACAASIAIGTEVAVFIGILCGFFAINWLVAGEKMCSGTMAFGLAFALGLALIFVGTIAPKNYTAIYCDALSFIILAAGLLGGLGLAAVAFTLSGKPLVWRMVSLGGLGVACAVLFLGLAPQCLSNPLSDLPPIVKTLWLDEVIEAQSVYDLRDKWATEIAYMMGTQITALAATLWLLKKGEDRRTFGLYLALIISALIFSCYQIRFYHFGFLFAVVPLAYWIGGLYARRAENPDQPQIAYILALAISLPYVWSIGALFTEDDSMASELNSAAINCFSDDVMNGLATLPEGAVLAIANGGPAIIGETPHRALNGNYHRNVEGIKTSIEMYTETPKNAETLLKSDNVNYVHVCRISRETISMTDFAPQGLLGMLVDHRVPDYLAPVSDFEDGAVTIYQVKYP